jgi:enoyl-CoA hydratase/carnithine racemase
MDGITMGGGVGISLHGSHPVATERFVFAMPETSIGFFPDIGASYLLARCSGKTGVYLGLTGNRLNAADAFDLGLINKIVSSEQLPQILESLKHCDLSVNPYARVDACLHAFTAPELQVSIRDERAAIDACFAEVEVERVFRALEERGDIWAKTILSQLEQKAPLSLKVTLAQIKKAGTMQMGECMQMDYCLVKHFMRDNDFYEGIRALLIDKDKTPHWEPQSLTSVTDAKVASYFEESDSELDLIEENNDS